MNYIKTYDNDLPKELCESLISTFEEKSKPIHDPMLGHRDFHEVNLMQCSEMKPFVQPMLENAIRLIRHYTKDCEIVSADFPKKFAMEEFRMKKYNPGSVGFAHHVDAVNLESAKRYLVFFWYLNDVEDGGETEFIHRDLRVSPQCGRALVFPPLWTYPHAGLPLGKSTKYICGGYLNYTD